MLVFCAYCTRPNFPATTALPIRPVRIARYSLLFLFHSFTLPYSCDLHAVDTVKKKKKQWTLRKGDELDEEDDDVIEGKK